MPGETTTGRRRPARPRATRAKATGGDAKLAARLANELRTKILGGEWRDGHVLPSQSEMQEEYPTLSLVTLRGAIDRLADEGLVDKRQGRQSRVTYRDPGHRLVVRLHQLPADRVAEPPIAFASDPHSGTPERVWTERAVDMPREYAALLGMRAGDTVVERRLLLTIDGEPVLASLSYLPPELADGRRLWHAVEVGELAVVGHGVTADHVDERSRMPRPDEAALLGLSRGVPVKVLSYPCRVLVGERRLVAGVIVLARGDRVFLRWARVPQTPGA